MNEVTMRRVTAVHCISMSWRDIHKFAVVFDLPEPLQNMQRRYVDQPKVVVKSACQTSMQQAAQELIEISGNVTQEPCEVAVSFDASWKRRGFYRNLGFGAAISSETKRFLTMRYSLALASAVGFGLQINGSKTPRILRNVILVTKRSV